MLSNETSLILFLEEVIKVFLWGSSTYPDSLVVWAGEQLGAVGRKLHTLNPAQVATAVGLFLIGFKVPQLNRYIPVHDMSFYTLEVKQNYIFRWKALYLYSVVWECDCQQVTGRTGMTVLHRAQTIGLYLQQHVCCLHIKYLQNNNMQSLVCICAQWNTWRI